jgi:hypothetical protein
MGLLDDAIREHLDLQRRRGADPTEVARAEQEALGPVRREPEAGDSAEEPREHAHDEHADEHRDEPAPVHEPEPVAHDEPAVEEHQDEPDAQLDDIVQQPTTEFRVEDHHDDEDDRDEGPPADEDVLEETPDFLQETPEHDRLWFEQRPPRDFDFDG